MKIISCIVSYTKSNISLSIVLLFLFSPICHSQNSQKVFDKSAKVITYTTLETKLYKKFSFPCNNSDYKCFGYEVWEDDEDVGVKSISLDENNAYLTDVYHNNIKKVNIEDGTITSSIPIRNTPPSKSGLWLRDITIFNNKLYVTSDIDSIYVFDKDLTLIETIASYKGTKTFYRVTNDSLFIYLNSRQMPNKTILFDLQLITKTDSKKRINLTIPINKYKENSLLKDVQGNSYQITDNYILTKYGKLLLNTPLYEITGYIARNIDFKKDELAFYITNQSTLRLYVYKY
jgi:hypothetical protein